MNDELLLLGLLRREEMHGYQLVEFIERNLSACTGLKKSKAYFLLEKMASAGWVVSDERRSGKRPTRRVYRPTEQGLQVFWKMLRKQCAQFTPTYFQDDISLLFLDELPAEEAVELLKQRRGAMEELRERMLNAPPHSGASGWLVEHQVRYLSAELNWLDEIIQRVEEKGRVWNKSDE
ncbi:MAG: PadR family transcriptional regulator [Anaerolineae bacterium]|nr:PadR family transcriptional regulator [Anaerolineae bacterium]